LPKKFSFSCLYRRAKMKAFHLPIKTILRSFQGYQFFFMGNQNIPLPKKKVELGRHLI
jgi:hypothetical protein